MSTENLTSYLNNHLAGSVAALELLDHLMVSHGEPTMKGFLEDLRREVGEDQGVVQELLHRLGSRESGVRKAAAWATEKLARLRLLLAGPGSGGLGRLEGLEALALGIEGKRSLWLALAAAVETVPQIQALDLAGLERRAGEQHRRVETLRLEAAREAFAPVIPAA